MRMWADELGISVKELRKDELHKLYRLLNRLLLVRGYPDGMIDDGDRVAYLLACARAKGHSGVPFYGLHVGPGRVNARDFIPQDFGLETFEIDFKSVDEVTWIPDHYHESAVRVVTHLVSRSPPLSAAAQIIIAERAMGIEPLDWKHYPDKGLWAAKLMSAWFIDVKSHFEVRLVPFATGRAQPKPFGLIFIKDGWRGLKDITKDVRKY